MAGKTERTATVRVLKGSVVGRGVKALAGEVVELAASEAVRLAGKLVVEILESPKPQKKEMPAEGGEV